VQQIDFKLFISTAVQVNAVYESKMRIEEEERLTTALSNKKLT
jgi:hypothetical protein